MKLIFIYDLKLQEFYFETSMVSARVDWRANAPLPQTRVIRGDEGAANSKSHPPEDAPRRMTPSEVHNIFHFKIEKLFKHC